MKRISVLIVSVLVLIISSCSKKSHSSASAPVNEEKKVVVKRIKTAVPKVITVNDKYAKRSVDGRYYYDLEGHRYWRNNRDGKYYLFNKSMYTDEDFKSPGKN